MKRVTIQDRFWGWYHSCWHVLPCSIDGYKVAIERAYRAGWDAHKRAMKAKEEHDGCHARAI